MRLAKGDRIPSPILGPEYQIDEAGVQYVGLIFVTQMPLVNNGKPLVRQREAERVERAWRSRPPANASSRRSAPR